MHNFQFRSIRARLIFGYTVVVCLSILFFLITLIVTIHYYYKNSVTNIMKNQALLSSMFFHEYIENPNIFTQRQTILHSFSANSNAQVQLFESNGNILADTLSTPNVVPLYINNIESIRSQQYIIWQSRTNQENEPILGVTIPLYSNEEFIGYARFITSLQKTNQSIFQISLFLILLGIFTIFLSIGVGFQISKSFSEPISKITHASRKMSNGDYSVRIKEHRRDEIGQLGTTFNLMAKEIQDREDIKNNFISSISHDLRTPLTSIKGWAITLKSTESVKPSELEEGIDIIEKECDRLSEMVNRLLDFSKLNPKTSNLTLVPTDIRSILEDSISFVKPSIKRCHMKIQKTLPSHPVIVSVDPFYIKRAFDNILDNAIKYSGEGTEISIQMSVSKGSLSVCITDSGQGFPTKDLPFVKLKFYQGSNKKKGSGMGLAICDSIMELHHGRLTVENLPTKGAKICLEFPRKGSDAY
ncbi:MAG: HAMP domain-containing sensor histidine kinase [Caldisericia bacterium]|nr:HAMP domain-containing sensor histidine kinase [Caldisericia bacterium]MDD4614959.1 HAMP domain-containing sensor histidine kinase [Caldisericia bacterium]